jgi:hypothetical protein
MDCRIKSGNDAEEELAPVMPGFMPGIHVFPFR